jgi:hypothetical protein
MGPPVESDNQPKKEITAGTMPGQDLFGSGVARDHAGARFDHQNYSWDQNWIPEKQTLPATSSSSDPFSSTFLHWNQNSMDCPARSP